MAKMKRYIIVFFDRVEGELSSFAKEVEATSKTAAEKQGRWLAKSNGWRYIEARMPSE